MKVSFREHTWRKHPAFKELCKALLTCKSETDLANFLRDVGTLSELEAWSERWEVAKLIAKGIPYREIAKKTGASTTTITRVAAFLKNGNGYRKVLKKK